MAEVAGDDWLDVTNRDAREVQRAAAVQFAQQYLELFERNPTGRALLAHWVETIEERDIAPSAPHAEYAYYEGRRAFVRSIQRQVNLAKTEGVAR